jgi:hypothetical protein
MPGENGLALGGLNGSQREDAAPVGPDEEVCTGAAHDAYAIEKNYLVRG